MVTARKSDVQWLSILAFVVSGNLVIGGNVVSSLPEHNVLLVNHTGLAVARIEIGERKLDTLHSNETEVLVHVAPGKHHLRIVFRGGANADWPHFNFRGIREVIFERKTNEIQARTE